MALKGHFNQEEWLNWEEPIRRREPEAVAAYKAELSEEMDYWKFLQFKFYGQWDKLRAYVNEKGIQIIGDIPIYVALDSADVWVHPELFQLDPETLKPLKVAGVPPDAFSETGQLWGNPLYDWNSLEKTDFAWWRDRMKAAARLYDVVRIDHFIGVVQYYSIPYGAEDGRTGEWRKGPGEKLTKAVNEAAGKTKIIAEDLGVFCPEVKELLQKTGYPGMKIIEFAFSGDRFNEHLPHCYEPNSVVYGGTHDNETLIGYFKPEKRPVVGASVHCGLSGRGPQGRGSGPRVPGCLRICGQRGHFPDAGRIKAGQRRQDEYAGNRRGKLEMEDEAGGLWRQ